MNSSRSVRVSKLLSLMLRHRPEEFGVELDRYGFAGLDAVLDALKEQDEDIEMEDIETVVHGSEKKRFEIVEGRIRARYGHSISIDLGIDPTEPPEYLYKGVDPSEVDLVLAEGLKPVDRKYVHLSFEAEVAAQLGGGRRRRRGAVIRVDARRAHGAGVPFYDCGPTILTPEVPPDFLEAEDRPEARPAAAADRQETAGSVPEGPITYGRKRKSQGGRR